MSGLTDMVRRSRITPVMAVLLAFIVIDLSVAMPAQLEKMQAKAKAIGLDLFDWSIFLLLFVGCIGKTMAAYMNKGWTRYADERDAAHKEEIKRFETEHAKGIMRNDPITKKEGHLK